MKKLIFLFIALVAMASSSIAQSDSVNFEITISNPAAISGTTPSGLPIFVDATFNSILASYYITEFKPALSKCSPTIFAQYLSGKM